MFYTILKNSIKIALILFATVARYGPAVVCIWIAHLQELQEQSHIRLCHSERNQFSSFPKGLYYKDAVVNSQPVVFSSIQATFPVQLVQGKSTSMWNSEIQKWKYWRNLNTLQNNDMFFIPQSGYLLERPPNFPNPVKFCFHGSQISCGTCEDIRLITCSWCKAHLCFQHLFTLNHLCYSYRD